MRSWPIAILVASACDLVEVGAGKVTEESSFARVGRGSHEPTWFRNGTQELARFGSDVSSGDVNGDGFADLLVGALDWPVLVGDGNAYLFLGSSDGLPEERPDWDARRPGRMDGWVTGVTVAGDVNSDGFDDVLLSDWRNERVYLYLGASAGLGNKGIRIISPNAPSDQFGWLAAAAGDVNGDGFDDVVIGAPDYDVDGLAFVGAVYVFAGSADGLDTASPTILLGDLEFDHFGDEVASAGDVNGDGFDDIIVASSFAAFDPDGFAEVFHGSAAGVSSEPAWRVEGDGMVNGLGVGVAGAGDVNGDGFDDVLVSHGTGSFLFFGTAHGLQSKVGWSSSDMTSNSEPAGDLNGDGFDDIVIGDPLGANGDGSVVIFAGSSVGPGIDPVWEVKLGRDVIGLEGSDFGSSVTAVNDVNGDGKIEIAAGAMEFDVLKNNGEIDRAGAVFLYEFGP